MTENIIDDEEYDPCPECDEPLADDEDECYACGWTRPDED